MGVTEPGKPRPEGTGYFGVPILTPETEKTTHDNFAATRWKKVWEVAGPERTRPVWLDIGAGIARWRKIVEQRLEAEGHRGRRSLAVVEETAVPS